MLLKIYPSFFFTQLSRGKGYKNIFFIFITPWIEEEESEKKETSISRVSGTDKGRAPFRLEGITMGSHSATIFRRGINL